MNVNLTLSGRLASLDFLRGLTMVLLTLESTLLFEHLVPVFEGTWGSSYTKPVFSSSLARTSFLGSDSAHVYVCGGVSLWLFPLANRNYPLTGTSVLSGS